MTPHSFWQENKRVLLFLAGALSLIVSAGYLFPAKRSLTYDERRKDNLRQLAYLAFSFKDEPVTDGKLKIKEGVYPGTNPMRQ